MTPLDRAIKALGGRGQLAELCHVTYQATQHWTNTGVPGKHVLAIEQATKDTAYPVTAHELLEWSAQKREAASIQDTAPEITTSPR